MATDLTLRFGRRVAASYRIEDTIRGYQGAYVVGDRIAQGGNAVVHECEEELSGESLAVKFQLQTSGKRLARFDNERDLLRVARHEHLIPYVDEGRCFGQGLRSSDTDLPFVVMRRGDRDLRQLLDAYRDPIPYDVYVGQMRGLSGALGILHDHAVHRDIKPSNILVAGEHWMLSDYGLCTLTDPPEGRDLTGIDERLGPNNWLSPEEHTRWCGYSAPIGKPSDVLQLAAIFWLVVNQEHPGGIVSELDWKGPHNLYPPIERALQHDPNRRPQNGREFHELIADAILST